MLFLAVVGATAAEATQVVGALLLVGLLAVPTAAAQRLSSRPWRAFALSGLFGVIAIWALKRELERVTGLRAREL